MNHKINHLENGGFEVEKPRILKYAEAPDPDIKEAIRQLAESGEVGMIGPGGKVEFISLEEAQAGKPLLPEGSLDKFKHVLNLGPVTLGDRDLSDVLNMSEADCLKTSPIRNVMMSKAEAEEIVTYLSLAYSLSEDGERIMERVKNIFEL